MGNVDLTKMKEIVFVLLDSQNDDRSSHFFLDDLSFATTEIAYDASEWSDDEFLDIVSHRLFNYFLVFTDDLGFDSEYCEKYARKAKIEKRVHPHLFRHQILTYLTSKGIVDAKIQLISGHKNRESLSIYQDLSLSDIEKEYWDIMKDFPIQ